MSVHVVTLAFRLRVRKDQALRYALVLLYVTVMSPFVPVATAGENFFLGLWEGVDPEDGSEVLYSLSDNDRNGVIEITGRKTFFTTCNGDGGVTGKGSVGQGGILEAELLLKCRPGPEVPGSATFTPIKRDGVLVFVVPVNDPAALPVVLHRVSRR